MIKILPLHFVQCVKKTFVSNLILSCVNILSYKNLNFGIVSSMRDDN